VGGLGLTGAMGINVLERTREIGVMRAIGARDRSVAGVFIVEGIAIGVLSWLLSIAASLPLGRALINVIGPKLLGSPLTCHFSMTGVLLWLGLVVVLSTFASLLPARSAARLTVREVLAYE
jgi:putative ABC transport system permease protein